MIRQPVDPVVDKQFDQDLELTSASVQHHDEHETLIHQLFERLFMNLEQRKKDLINEAQTKFMEANTKLLTGVRVEKFHCLSIDFRDFLIQSFPLDSEKGLTHHLAILHLFHLIQHHIAFFSDDQEEKKSDNIATLCVRFSPIFNQIDKIVVAVWVILF